MFLPAQSFDPALNESISSTNLAESSSHPNGMGLGKDDTKREDFREGGFSLTPAISRSEVFYDLRHRRSSGIISTPNSLLFRACHFVIVVFLFSVLALSLRYVLFSRVVS